MGSGCWTTRDFAAYSVLNNKCYSEEIGRVTGGQEFTSHRLDESLNPKNAIRECCNTEEHPNTIPVILALDVTGSMGAACQECAEALNVIMTDLYKKFKDIEFCIMGIGDLAYDDAPIQASQFESDIRIAEALDKVYMEHGGGGNKYESYTSAWYFGLHNTKLDCFDFQGRKGIIITMGDEPLNPYLPKVTLNKSMGSTEQSDVETNTLYKEAKEKFEIYHIGVNEPSKNMFRNYALDIHDTWGKLLGKNYKETNVNGLSNAIYECIDDAVNKRDNNTNIVNENGISW